MSIKDDLVKDKLPGHVAIIMDGNGRWAKKKGNARVFGHKNGVTSVRQTVEAAAELGLQYLTLYAFSTENWGRPKSEINALMDLLAATVDNELKTLLDNNVRLLTIGDLESLPRRTEEKLRSAKRKTADNTGLNLVLALSYSARWEIVQAVKDMAHAVRNGQLLPDEIDQDIFKEFLTTRDIPDPELLIRTSGELRLSNFMLWQLAYTELYFTPTLWPDFRKENFYQALLDFQNRERRFGKTGEQVSPAPISENNGVE